MSGCFVISGPPAAGKSTLARWLAAARGWPLLAKDAYKERVFERLGADDRDWSRHVSQLAWDLLFDEAERWLAAGACCVLDGNFRPAEALRLQRLPVPPARLVEIRCSAAPTVLLQRYRERAASGTRHSGHVDLEALPEIEAELAAASAATGLALGGALLLYDTTDGFAPEALDAQLRPLLRDWDSG